MKFSVEKYRKNNNDIEVENEELKGQLERIDNFYANEIKKIKLDHEREVEKLKNEIKMLESRALINPRKITVEQVNNIKELRAKGLSFRVIAQETKLSTCTIQRALKGVYD